MKKLFLVVAGLVTVSGWAAYQAPVELFCNISEAGGSLSCQYFNGKDTKALTDQDVPGFIDRAATQAYLTLKSKKGLERTFLIDTNAVPFKKLNDMRARASVTEISRAKLEIFTEIEKKAIKISGDMDAAAAQAELVKNDSSIANDKFKKQISALTIELNEAARGKAKASSGKEEDASVEKENQEMGRLLSELLTAFSDPESCLGDMKLNVGTDGSVDLAQVDEYAKRFAHNCKSAKTGGGAHKTDSAPMSGTALAALLSRNKGRPETDGDKMECSPKYLQGPFVIGANACGKTSLCYGLASCGLKGQAKSNTRVTCEAQMMGDASVCAPPTECLRSRDVMLFSRNVKVSSVER